MMSEHVARFKTTHHFASYNGTAPDDALRLARQLALGA
jgi:hypothetical protein